MHHQQGIEPISLFQQRMMVCDHWYMVNCNSSELDYSANQLIGQRDKPFVSPEEHLKHREPVEFFTRQQNPGSLQRGSLFSDVTSQKQKYHVDISSPGADSGRLGDGIVEQYRSLNSVTSAQDPSTNRRARHRNINTSRSQPSVPQTSTPPDSDSTVYFRTLPLAYTNNPFFQNFLLRTTPSTPQGPTDTSVSSELHGSTGQVTESKTFIGESAELEVATDSRVPLTQALPQQSLTIKPRDLAFALGIPEVENFPTSLTQQEVPETYINEPLLQALTKTDALPLPVPITAPNVDQKSPQTNVNFGENEDNFGNTVELHLLDHRRMFFIPDSDQDAEGPSSYDRQTGDTTLLSISVPNASPAMHFRHNTEVTAGHNLDCPRCYPGFLVPGTCHPCVIIR